MNTKKCLIWPISFIILVVFPYTTYPFLKSYLSSLDYGKRNAAYTYVYHGEYYDTTDYSSISSETPSFVLDSTLPRQIDTYIEDSIPYKKLLIMVNSMLHYYILNQSTNSSVIIGSDDWLFFKDATSKYSYDYHFSEAELELILNNLQGIQKNFQDNEKELVIFIAPNKETIYSEYLPSNINVDINLSPAVQLVNYLNENSTIKVIFPVKDLMNAKEKYPELVLYHKLDTHWNNAGGYIAAQSLVKELGKELPNIDTLKIDTLVFSSSDLTHMIGMPIKNATTEYIISSYGEESTVLDHWDYYDYFMFHNPHESQNLIMYRDSFASALSQPLSTKFGNSLYPLSGSNFDLVYSHNADIVIFEFVERNIHNIKELKLNK